MVARSRAPLRLGFAGGGTDVAPFPETETGAVLAATIDRYAYGSLTPRQDCRISVHSLDLGMSLDFDARVAAARSCSTATSAGTTGWPRR